MGILGDGSEVGVPPHPGMGGPPPLKPVKAVGARERVLHYHPVHFHRQRPIADGALRPHIRTRLLLTKQFDPNHIHYTVILLLDHCLTFIQRVNHFDLVLNSWLLSLSI